MKIHLIKLNIEIIIKGLKKNKKNRVKIIILILTRFLTSYTYGSNVKLSKGYVILFLEIVFYISLLIYISINSTDFL